MQVRENERQKSATEVEGFYVFLSAYFLPNMDLVS